ncbi:SagB family peptide dehydrogenase [Nocardia ignorata]|uniref:SagB-type dehydrogenase family enzyme n=1 Tax=Nocardia ignorata TaxID=145285 RepID=A0A4R6PNQ9_NOCIG|nr:SagB family peptide dehydrogenase [Nocardia ignorata]TDP39738.1 SagB-type dehydrogenase family enzyme [Nocardia ignorata]
MLASPYPAQTRFALRAGVTCLTTPAGAVLLNPPRNEKLTGLGAGALQALKTLNQGPATAAEMATAAAGDDITGLMRKLTDGGWLAVTVRDGGRDLYSIRPFAQPAPRPEVALPTWSATLSKFAVLHRDAQGFVLEHPRSWCDLRIHDPRLLALLDGPLAADSPVAAAVKTQFMADLQWCGFLVDGDEEEHEFTTRSWNAPDLWFHRRSTLGARTVTWDDFGPTRWAEGKFPELPARRAPFAGDPIFLPKPDLVALRVGDPSLSAALEDRVSTRAFDDSAPVTAAQLGELLFRSARTREDGSRPYPSGGGAYELEVYPAVRNVAGLESGLYHYDSVDHALRHVAPFDSPAVQKLVKSTSATLAGGAEPQVVLLVSARAGRVMWSYEQVAYANILKHVGVFMQTVYLSATAMNLGVVAQGFSDTSAFATATGIDELEECNVGSIIVGSPAR